MSGSDLIRLFRGSISHFWKTDLSQIYRALESLESEGYLRSRSLPSNRGPARRVYRLTDRGRRRLTEWIRQPPTIPPTKLEFLAQLFSVTADERPRERAREMLASMRGEAAATIAALARIEALYQEVTATPEELPAFLFYPWLTLRHGIIRRRALVEWIDECLGVLERRPDAADADAGPESMSALVRALRDAAGETGADERQTDETGKDKDKEGGP